MESKEDKPSIERLNGKNWAVWSLALKAILRSKNLLKYLSPRTDGEGDSPHTWKTNSNRMIGIIVNSIKTNEIRYIGDQESPIEIWRLLRERYASDTPQDRVFFECLSEVRRRRKVRLWMTISMR